MATNGGSAEYHREYRRRRKTRGSTSLEAPSALQVSGKVQGGANAAVAPEPPPRLEPAVVGAVDEGEENANSDAQSSETEIVSGTYELVRLGGANSDAILAHIAIISGD